MMEIKIGKRKIGPGYPTFIVAELSGNHHQKYAEAVRLVKAAKEAGADAVKLQTYTPDTITIDSRKKWFLVGGKDNPKNWQQKSLYELYQGAYTPWEWQPKLKKLADRLGLILFSSPFDQTAVDFLKKMKVPCYKIASYEVNDLILLKRVAQTGKPVIMSVGYASPDEIQLALATLRKNGAKEIAILHCVTGYSSKPNPADMNLATIPDIQKRFGVVSGFSDNNSGIGFAVQAAIMGASIIEKHLILDRKSGGPDARFSLEPQEFKKMVEAIRRAEKARGRVSYGPISKLEAYNRRWRRSLFVVEDIKKGKRFTPQNIRSIRPAFGLHTKYYEKVLGKKAARDIERGTPLSWSLVRK